LVTSKGIVVGKYLNCDQFDLGYSATDLMCRLLNSHSSWHFLI